MLILRAADTEDSLFLYELRTETTTLKNSIKTQSFSMESHLIWLKESLKSKNRLIFIAEIGSSKVGMGRIDFADNDLPTLSWAVHPIHRKKGYGSVIVEKLCLKSPNCQALIKPSNIASIKAAEKNNFVLFKTEKDLLTYIRK